jgi:hypothetical protein
VFVAVVAGVLVCLVTVAGAGIYFMSKRVHAERASPVEALSSFDQVTKAFETRQPLFELTSDHEPRLRIPLESLPTSATPATDLWVQAWNPEEQRLVRLSLPLWLLRFGDHKMRVFHGDGGVSLRDLSLDADELARVGSAIVLDYRRPSGVRILLWTK